MRSRARKRDFSSAEMTVWPPSPPPSLCLCPFDSTSQARFSPDSGVRTAPFFPCLCKKRTQYYSSGEVKGCLQVKIEEGRGKGTKRKNGAPTPVLARPSSLVVSSLQPPSEPPNILLPPPCPVERWTSKRPPSDTCSSVATVTSFPRGISPPLVIARARAFSSFLQSRETTAAAVAAVAAQGEGGQKREKLDHRHSSLSSLARAIPIPNLAFMLDRDAPCACRGERRSQERGRGPRCTLPPLAEVFAPQVATIKKRPSDFCFLACILSLRIPRSRCTSRIPFCFALS